MFRRVLFFFFFLRFLGRGQSKVEDWTYHRVEKKKEIVMDVDRTDLEVSLPRVQAGEWVLVVDNEKRFCFALASHETTVRLGKRACNCGPFVGAVYGTYFEAVNGKLVEMQAGLQNQVVEDLLGDETTGTASADNRDMTDKNNTQGLTQEAIIEMKSAGQNSELLVRKLVENSTSFAKRTEFSQEKYLRKKAYKHQIVVQIMRPTAALVCKAYFNKKAWRTQHMRPDTLAHIVVLANLQSGTRTLVIDDCIGLILGAALERANGRGRVFNLHQGNDCNPSLLRLFNFNSEQLNPLKHMPIDMVRGLLTSKNFTAQENNIRVYHDDDDDDPRPRRDTTDFDDDDDMGEDDAHSRGKKGGKGNVKNVKKFKNKGENSGENDKNKGENKGENKEEQDSTEKRIDPSSLPPKRRKKDQLPYEKVKEQEMKEGLTEEERKERKRKNGETRRLYRELKWQNLCDSRQELESHGVASLIIAGPSHPLAALNSCWRFLNLSGHFVLYSEFLEPLAECYEALFQLGCAVNMRLTETWARTYQVLPKRTHPLMNMSAASGYLLSGIKVEPVDTTLEALRPKGQKAQKETNSSPKSTSSQAPSTAKNDSKNIDSSSNASAAPSADILEPLPTTQIGMEDDEDEALTPAAKRQKLSENAPAEAS